MLVLRSGALPPASPSGAWSSRHLEPGLARDAAGICEASPPLYRTLRPTRSWPGSRAASGARESTSTYRLGSGWSARSCCAGGQAHRRGALLRPDPGPARRQPPRQPSSRSSVRGRAGHRMRLAGEAVPQALFGGTTEIDLGPGAYPFASLFDPGPSPAQRRGAPAADRADRRGGRPSGSAIAQLRGRVVPLADRQPPRGRRERGSSRSRSSSAARDQLFDLMGLHPPRRPRHDREPALQGGPPARCLGPTSRASSRSKGRPAAPTASSASSGCSSTSRAPIGHGPEPGDRPAGLPPSCPRWSSVGPIDPAQLFYLESRGITPRRGPQVHHARLPRSRSWPASRSRRQQERLWELLEAKWPSAATRTRAAPAPCRAGAGLRRVSRPIDCGALDGPRAEGTMRMAWVDGTEPLLLVNVDGDGPRGAGHLQPRVLRAGPRVPHRGQPHLRAAPLALRPRCPASRWTRRPTSRSRSTRSRSRTAGSSSRTRAARPARRGRRSARAWARCGRRLRHRQGRGAPVLPEAMVQVALRPAADLAVDGRCADELLVELPVRGVHDQRQRLRAAEAPVRADELLEGRDLLELGVVQADHRQVGHVVHPVEAQERLARAAAVLGDRIHAFHAVLLEEVDALATDDDGAVLSPT